MSKNAASLVSPGGLKITGAWTRAGMGSCVHVQGTSKKEDFLFDCGVLDPEILSAQVIFVTHGHADHIGACFNLARSRSLGSNTTTCYAPADAVEPLQQACDAFGKLDGNPISMEILPLNVGDEIQLDNLIVKVFPTIHRVPSQGYAVYRKSPAKLLPQFLCLSGNEIGQLRKEGIKIYSDPEVNLELVYTGDTTFAGLLGNEFVFRAPILVMELTYLDGDRGKASQWGHIHMDDLVENEHLFENEAIVFVHLSAKYAPSSKALNIIRQNMPPSLLQRGFVSLKMFGSNETLTRLARVDWNQKRNEVGWGWAERRSGSGGGAGGGRYTTAGSGPSVKHGAWAAAGAGAVAGVQQSSSTINISTDEGRASTLPSALTSGSASFQPPQPAPIPHYADASFTAGAASSIGATSTGVGAGVCASLSGSGSAFYHQPSGHSGQSQQGHGRNGYGNHVDNSNNTAAAAAAASAGSFQRGEKKHRGRRPAGSQHNQQQIPYSNSSSISGYGGGGTPAPPPIGSGPGPSVASYTQENTTYTQDYAHIYPQAGNGHHYSSAGYGAPPPHNYSNTSNSFNNNNGNNNSFNNNNNSDRRRKRET